MSTVTLRTSGGDFNTWNSMVAGVNALFPLASDVIVNVQGGQTFGTDSDGGNTVFGAGLTASWNNRRITLQTDPAELATPATILGVIVFQNDYWFTDGVSGLATVKQIKHVCSVANRQAFDAIVHVTLLYEDNLLVMKQNNNTPWCASAFAGIVFINNNTIVKTVPTVLNPIVVIGIIPGNSGKVHLNNNLLLFRADHGNVALNNGSGGIMDSNTIFSYGAYAVTTGTGTWTNTVSGTNPNLVGGAVITDENEDPYAVMARDLRLTSSSSSCIGNANIATASLVDINGKSRS